MRSSTLLVLVLAVAAGCVSMVGERNYVEPSPVTTRYEDLSRPEQPLLLRISVIQTYDGRSYAIDPDSPMRARVVRVLRESGFVRSSHAGEDGSIEVTVNDAPAKRLREGRGPGWHAREVLELSVVISTGGRTATRNYERAILRYRGDAREAAGLTERVGPGEAIDIVVEQMLLRALLDFQREGVLPAGKRT